MKNLRSCEYQTFNRKHFPPYWRYWCQMLPVCPRLKLLSSRCLLRVFEQCTCPRVSMCGCCMVIYCVLIETVLTFTNSDLKNKQHTHTHLGLTNNFEHANHLQNLWTTKPTMVPALLSVRRYSCQVNCKFPPLQCQTTKLTFTNYLCSKGRVQYFSIFNMKLV